VRRRLPALALALGVVVGGPLATDARTVPRLGPAPNFALTTSQNARLWLTHLRPRIVVLTFGCTRCVACAEVLSTLARVAGGLGEQAGQRVFFALVSVDPARDTPAVLRAFGRERGLLAPAWLLLTGDPEEINVVTRLYDAPVRRDGNRVAPRCQTALVDGQGQLRAAYDQTDLDRLGADLAAVLAEGPPR
jgi:protein SCO1